LRPRKFGKSMLISMLVYYYEYKLENNFNDIFGNTWIGSNPTPLKNSLSVLKLDFSGINLNKPLVPQFTPIIASNLQKFIVDNNIDLAFPINYNTTPSQFTNEFFDSITGFKRPIYISCYR
jgi:hypothetical protein